MLSRMGVLVLVGLTRGQQVRISRIAHRWRQVDLAAFAGVEQFEVSRLELDYKTRPNAVAAILAALGLEDFNA